MNKKENKGITLVALVITIIVLIILAGVSINAVMNDGLITNAKNARDDYEVAKRKEEIALKDLEVQTDFLENGTTYYFRNGFLTGVEYIKTGEEIDEDGTKWYESVLTETVGDMQKKLPKGYEIWTDTGDTEAKADDAANVVTGMILKKNGNEIGRIVVFGDVDLDVGGNGSWYFDGSDYGNIHYMALHSRLMVSIKYDWQIAAMDVNHDNILNEEDEELIKEENLWQILLISQDAYAPNPSELVKKLQNRLEQMENE